MLHIGVKLVDQGGHRQACTVALGFIEHQPQVLAHPVHRKTKLKLARHHGFAPVVELPALRCAFANDVKHLVHVQPGLLAKGDGLRQTLHEAGNANLVHHLGQLAGAALARAGDGFGKRHGHGLSRVKSRSVAATHDREQAVLGTRLTTRYRGVDKVQAQVFGRAIQLTRHAGRRRGVVHKDRAGRHAGKGAVGAQRHLAQVGVVAHTAKHKFRATRRFQGCFGMFYSASRRIFSTPCY